MDPHIIYNLSQSIAITFIMDYVILWAAGETLGKRKGLLRLLAGALSATLIFLLIIILYGYNLFDIVSLPSIALAVFSMLLAPLIAFAPVNMKTLLQLTGLNWFFSCVAGGSAFAVLFITDGSLLLAFGTAIAIVLALSELGWGILTRKIKENVFYIPIEIEVEGEEVAVNALIDTGNQLREPISGSPVIVLEYDAVKSLLPPEVRWVFEEAGGGDLSSISRLNPETGWLSRLRVIPFTSLGKERGMLLGFKPDAVRINCGKHRLDIKKVIIGVHNRQLSPEGAYKALLHPELLQTA